jgi:S-adenosylmethionine-dependent methyltransferase
MSDQKVAADQNFDGLGERFARNIYDTPKGEIRLQLVCEELREQCPSLSGTPLRILDAGCGLGQITVMLVGLGHHMVSCDVSSSMLERARDRLNREALAGTGSVEFIHAPVQELDRHVQGAFDLVIFHAVLEWMEHPQEGLLSLLPWLKQDGILSLMFYNRHALVFKNLLRGHFRKIEQLSFRGEEGGLTPLNPLDPADVEQWLSDAGWSVYARRGIRTFFDYMDANRQPPGKESITAGVTTTRNAPSLEDIIRMERHYGLLEPYRSLGRYQLWHCRRVSPRV